MLCCFALLFFDLACFFFLPSASLIKTCVQCVPRINKKEGGGVGGDLAGAQSVNLYLGEGPGASEYLHFNIYSTYVYIYDSKVKMALRLILNFTNFATVSLPTTEQWVHPQPAGPAPPTEGGTAATGHPFPRAGGDQQDGGRGGAGGPQHGGVLHLRCQTRRVCFCQATPSGYRGSCFSSRECSP